MMLTFLLPAFWTIHGHGYLSSLFLGSGYSDITSAGLSAVYSI